MRIGSISQYIKNADVPRIHRALACSISNFGKYFLLFYVGANPSTSAKTIYKAILGQICYNIDIDDTKKSKIFSLNIGFEDGKDNKFI